MMLLYDEDESKDDHDHDYIGLLGIVFQWSLSEKMRMGRNGQQLGCRQEELWRPCFGEILSMISFANACVFFMYVQM